MKKKLLLMLNPHAGKAEVKNKLLDIVDLFVKAGYDVTVRPTQRRLEIPDILRDEALLGKKRAHEAHFRGAVQGDPALAQRFGSLWDELAAAATQKRELQPKVMFYAPSYSPVIERAVAMAKAFDETLGELVERMRSVA